MATTHQHPDRHEESHAERGPRCDVALSAAFAVLGKRWTGVILGVLADGEAGFAELSRGVGGPISDSVLAARLTELVTGGLVDRRVDTGPPIAVRYALTPTGQALIPALRELGRWARDHLLTDTDNARVRR
ncbi:MAG TPA: helix-turn-helix domain-containing protein [Actinophytocola sp.]|jgi:DNA-binding HxlR family transcriptional regulator|nr:helix-turn-helix domain-containing protein [Actinophytocola sp.]